MIDYHTHSRFSPDGGSSMAQMTQAALKDGLGGLAFTEHAEWIPEDEGYGYLDPQAYFDALTSLRQSWADRSQHGQRLTLLAGLELGNPHEFPQEVSEILASWPWDIALGSLHWVDGKLGCMPVAFEGSLEPFYQRYFEELAVMVAEAEYDILGHLDIVRRDSWVVCQRILPLEPYADLIRQVLRIVIERGKGIEVNTSGWRKGMAVPLPELKVLQWYRELGAELLVFGSDAHAAGQIAWRFDRARELALVAGFTRLPRFEKRRVVGWMAL
jgi:histidinol-phosphatase (PHP family)